MSSELEIDTSILEPEPPEQPAAPATGSSQMPAKPVFDTPVAAPYVQDLNGVDSRLAVLGQFEDPVPDENNPNAVFYYRYIQKGSTLLLVAPSGVGKSSFTIQAALRWTKGEEAFGLKPAHPLSICIIQAEDSKDECAEFRNQITQGLEEKDPEAMEYHQYWNQIFFYDCTGLAGEAFFIKGLAPLLEKYAFDLVIINPLFAYLGGQGVSDQKTVSDWLRVRLEPLIRERCAVLIVHHTNKISASPDKRPSSTEFSEYLGSGSAELVNFFRAVLVLMPIMGVQRHFRLIAAKRGGRLKWPEVEGESRPTRFFKHDEHLIFWREVSVYDVPAPVDSKKKAASYGDKKEDGSKLAEELRNDEATTLVDLRDDAIQRWGTARGRRAYDWLMEHALESGLIIEKKLDPAKPAMKVIGTPMQIKERKKQIEELKKQKQNKEGEND